MDIFGFPVDPMVLIPFLTVAATLVFFAILFYTLYYKPKIQKPLPNERFLGFITLWIPKGFGLKAGYATTARRTLEKMFTDIMENEADEEAEEKLAAAKQIFDSFHPIAHRASGENYIYLFDMNPQDQKYMDVDPTRNDAYIIHGVQDAISVGEWKGFKFLGLALNPGHTKLSPEEHTRFQLGVEAVKYLRDAAKNTLKIATLKDELEDTRSALEKTLKEKAEIRSKLDRALSALSQKTLTQPEEVKVKGAWRAKVKEWFNWPQFLTAAVAYLIAPHLLTWFNITLQPPGITYFVAFITIVGFFIIPVGKKMFGRWL